MSRTDAMPNRILDALVTLLGTINAGTAPTEWLTTPKTVTRHHRDPINAVRPALIVGVGKYGPNEPGTGRVHRAQATIEVDCVVSFTTAVDDPARDLHRLVSDVLKAVETDVQLGGVLSSGFIQLIDGYTPSKQLSDVAGLAACTIVFLAEWEWSALNP